MLSWIAMATSTTVAMPSSTPVGVIPARSPTSLTKPENTPLSTTNSAITSQPSA